MRLLLGFATVLAIAWCLFGGRDHTKLENCPEDTVCLIFSHTICSVGGAKASSFYIWETEETTKTQCQDRTYNALYARLDITPVKLTKWKMVATLYVKKNGKEVVNPEEYSFKFKNAELKFIGENRVQFLWNKNGKSQTLDHPLNQMEPVSTQDTGFLSDSDEYEFNRLAFEIEANGEKLIDFIGPVVTLSARDHNPHLIDTSFPSRIGELSKCDKSEIKKACHGSCEQIVFTDQTVKCKSTLWYAKNDWSEDWRSLDRLNCTMGYWQAEWGGESVYVDSSIAIECSASKPESPYASTRLGIIIGSTIGGVVLLALILAGIFFVVRYFKKREADKPTTKRVPSFRICDFPSPLNESAKSPGDTVPEYTAHTFESAKTTLSEKTATAKMGKQSAESLGSGKRPRNPSTGTKSMKFDTATFTPSFQDGLY